MILTARIRDSISKLEIFDAQTGGIHRSHSLPPGTYSGLAISGDVVSVSITDRFGNMRIQTLNMKTGAMISNIGV